MCLPTPVLVSREAEEARRVWRDPGLQGRASREERFLARREVMASWGMKAAAAGILAFLLAGCGRENVSASVDLVVFHAGSLALPMRRISRAFMREHPGIRVMCEAAGSRVCARKITDLGRRCDVMISADDTVIRTMLMPEHASWSIVFASTEMCIAFRDSSAFARRIGPDNWPEVLLRDTVRVGRSDPDLDPCGYRALFTMKLAERFFKKKGLAHRLEEKSAPYVRPKSVDLLALLEAGELDYIFEYRSVAVQHGLRFVRLPAEMNLGDPAHADTYRTVSVTVSGKKPGTVVEKRGRPIAYGITVPRDAPHPEEAVKFVSFFLSPDKGLAVLKQCGFTPLVPVPTATFDRIPPTLKGFARAAR